MTITIGSMFTGYGGLDMGLSLLAPSRTAWTSDVAETLTKGMQVIAQGRLVQRSFTTREGDQRTVVEIQVDEIGPSLRYARAQVSRMGRGAASQGQAGSGWGQQPQAGRSTTPASSVAQVARGAAPRTGLARSRSPGGTQ